MPKREVAREAPRRQSNTSADLHGEAHTGKRLWRFAVSVDRASHHFYPRASDVPLRAVIDGHPFRNTQVVVLLDPSSGKAAGILTLHYLLRTEVAYGVG